MTYEVIAKIDQEVQWNSIPYNLPNENLSIFTGPISEEAIIVEVWNGNDWENLLSNLLPHSWNNISISSYLVGPTFTIRLIDDSHSGDVSIDSWFIDYMHIHIWDDITPPSLISPSNRSYIEGDPGNILQWNASDTHFNTYEVYRDSNPVQSGSWNNTTPIAVNIDGLSFGEYEYSIFVYDDSNNFVGSSVFINVIDGDDPYFTSTPILNSYEEDTTDHSLTWVAEDAHPSHYELFRNTTKISSGAWGSGFDIFSNIDGLDLGVYNFTLKIYDLSGNYANDTRFISVNDTKKPEFTNIPSNLQYPNGTVGNELTWIAFDKHPQNYVIYEGVVLFDNGNWNSSGSITINIDGLIVGVYNYTIIVYDSSTNNATSIVTLTVTSNPVFTSVPGDLTYNNDTTENEIVWILSDSDPNAYAVYRNDTVEPVQSSTWSNALPITVNVDGLALGVYNYTIWVNDTEENIVTDWVLVTVNDNPKWIQSQGDIWFYEGTAGHNLQWRGGDSAPYIYYIYQNGTEVDSNTWDNDNNVTLNIEDLFTGYYNFTIVLWDQTNNQISHTVFVSVFDNTPPELTDLTDQFFIEGTLGSSLSWNATDIHPANYTIYLNSEKIQFGNWNNTNNITILLDGLTIGDYNYTVIIQDESGNPISDQLILTVIDQTKPIIQGIPSTSYSEGSPGNIIRWNVSDIHPANYTILADGSPIENGNWSTRNNITITIDGLIKGSYEYKLLINDTSGNSANHTIIINVIDDTPPTHNDPSNITYAESDIGIFEINWNITDSYPGNYTVYKNGSEIIDYGNWMTSTNITIDVNGLLKGVYNYTIVANDSSGNDIVNSVLVTVIVIDTTDPLLWDTITNYEYIEGSTNNFFVWNATDRYPDYYIISLDGEKIEQSSWDNSSLIMILIDGLSKAVYDLTIEVFDESGNIGSNTILIDVIDVVAPVIISSPANSTFVEGTVDNFLIWAADDLYPAEFIIFRNNVEIATGSWGNNISISIRIDTLIKGDYNFTIQISDETGNHNISMSQIRMIDLTNPEINSPPNMEYIEGTINHNLIWVASDTYHSHYVIYQNSTEITTGFWFSPLNIIENIDGLFVGTYNFTIVIYDESNNTASNTIIVTVIDRTNPLNNFHLEDTIYVEGSAGHFLYWNVFDRYPDSFTLFLANQTIHNGTWFSNENVTWTLDGLMKGSYNFTIRFLDQYGNFIDLISTVTVIDLNPPIIYPYDNNLVFPANTTGNNLYWNITDFHPDSYTITRNGLWVIGGSWESGILINITIDGLDVGIYNFTLSVWDTSLNYNSNSIIIEVEDPKLIKTIVTWNGDDVATEFFEGDVQEISGEWYTIESSQGIVEGQVRATLFENQKSIRSINALTNENGEFILYLNYTSLPSGSYTWIVSLIKSGYVGKEFEIDFTLHPHNYVIEIQNLDELVQGEAYDIVVIVTYNNLVNDLIDRQFGLNGINVTHRTGRAFGVEVELELSLTRITGESRSITLTSTTDENGIALFTLSGDETKVISSLDEINAIVLASDFGESTSQSVFASDLPIVRPSESNIITQVFDFVTENIIPLLILVILILTTGAISFVLMRIKRNKLQLLLKENQTAIEEFQSLRSIRTILLKSNYGLLIYGESFSDVGVDPDLIAGLTSAISSFLDEVDSKEFHGFEVMQRSNLSITSHKGEFSTLISISNQNIQPVVLDQLKTAHHRIENQFEHIMTTSPLTISLAEEAQIMEFLDETDFKVNLLRNFIIDFRKLRKIDDVKIITKFKRKKIKILNDFPISEIPEGGIRSIDQIYEFLQSRDVKHDVIAQIIIICHAYGVFKPIR
ncbi:MAG: hypothetical protein ACW99Q_02180 [Candidatus Kariarchaeaceae archaeon]